MLDKLITYIVCWYKTLYQVLPVAWTNHFTTRRDIDPGSQNRLDLIQSLVPAQYVCNGYLSHVSKEKFINQWSRCFCLSFMKLYGWLVKVFMNQTTTTCQWNFTTIGNCMSDLQRLSWKVIKYTDQCLL